MLCAECSSVRQEPRGRWVGGVAGELGAGRHAQSCVTFTEFWLCLSAGKHGRL
jgi:hypothetical protein